MFLEEKLKSYFTQKEQYDEIYNAMQKVKTYHFTDAIYNFNFGLGVVEILLNVMADHHTVIAAIYYAVIKNKILTMQELKDHVSDNVSEILQAVLKVEQLKINTKESQAQNIKDMFIALAKDIRVIILKLAIELQKVLLIDKFEKPEQQVIMLQVKEIYSPIAAMISIGYIKSTLENELLKYYKPLEYAELNKQLHKYVEERNQQIKKSIEIIKKDIQPIDAQVYGRQKQISSIYKKIENKQKDLNQIFDILAIRVIVKTIEECYSVLGKIHAIYKPVGRFKDYIAQPKENGYQSLHTTVIVENGDSLEIQIRTQDMHTYAEYGFAAHWAYKEKRKVNESDKKISYIRSIMELHKEKSSDEILDALKIDVYSGNIFCQTPMGKVIQFVEGATPIDFAYTIHSKIGDTCVGAKINDKMVPLTTQLKNGDIVEIITNANSKGPSRDWLKIVKTSEARNKINAFFKREMKDENIKKGKSILEGAAKSKNLSLSKLFKEEFLEEVFDKYSLTNLDDMYASIGYGGLSANQVLSRLTNLYKEEEKKKPVIIENIQNKINTNTKANIINVLGYSNLMTKLAKCCNPLPGDEIIGYVSRGKGVTVHRTNCDALKTIEEERLIECSWNTTSSDSFIGALTIISVNNTGAIAAISKKIADLKLQLSSLKTSSKSKEEMVIHVGINVKKKEDLSDVIYKLKQLNVVHDIYRTK